MKDLSSHQNITQAKSVQNLNAFSIIYQFLLSFVQNYTKGSFTTFAGISLFLILMKISEPSLKFGLST